MAEEKAKQYVEDLGDIFHFKCYQENDPEGCHNYAEYLMMLKKDLQKASEVFETTCKEMRFNDSCLALGNMYLTGQGVEKSLQTALDLYVKSCNEGSFGACNNAGLVLQNGYETHPSDGKMAEEYFKRSCGGNFKNGCFNLSILHLQGKYGVAKDMEKALQYSLKSCELGHPWGCGNASRMLRVGDGVPLDITRADEMLKRAKELLRQGNR